MGHDNDLLKAGKLSHDPMVGCVPYNAAAAQAVGAGDRGVNLARIGYNAYGDAASWQNYEGKPMPQWDELPIHIREKWGAAARAIALAILPRS